MRRFYTILLYLLLPLIILRLFWKSRNLPAYRERLAERLSLGRLSTPSVDIWLHAVSLGEVVAATPLIQNFLDANYRVLVTTMTPSGSQQVIRRFGTRVSHQYIPYDFPYALRRFFKKIEARVGIIMETEIWPNLIVEANAHMPLFLANARISDAAFKQYRPFGWLFKPILNHFKYIMAQSPLDAERYQILGADVQRIQMLGNMKFDLSLTFQHLAAVKSLKKSWGEQRLVVIAASTHEGEEVPILAAFTRLQQMIPHVILLIAPRHSERFQRVVQLSQNQGYQVGIRSNTQSIHERCEIIIIDSLGELLSFYTLCDYAFVGGSFVPVGGHNVLEPIALGIPTFCGPYMQNSQSIIDELVSGGALSQVNNAVEWVEKLLNFHKNESSRLNQTEQASKILVSNQGAVSRHFELIRTQARI